MYQHRRDDQSGDHNKVQGLVFDLTSFWQVDVLERVAEAPCVCFPQPSTKCRLFLLSVVGQKFHDIGCRGSFGGPFSLELGRVPYLWCPIRC